MARFIVEEHDFATLGFELASSQNIPPLGEAHMASRSLPDNEFTASGHYVCIVSRARQHGAGSNRLEPFRRVCRYQVRERGWVRARSAVVNEDRRLTSEYIVRVLRGTLLPASSLVSVFFAFR